MSRLSSNILHVCIATGQNAANLIPLVQLQAQRILILETQDMRKMNSAYNLEKAVRSALPNQPEIEIFPLNDSNLQSVIEDADTLVQRKLTGQRVLFHISGGTKLMVLILQNRFIEVNIPRQSRGL